MKYKYELNWWDHYDQDRWISSAVISIFIVMLTYIVLKNIPLPELPKKPPIIEDFVFIEEKVQKKIVTKKILRPDEPTPQEIFEEEPEIVIEVFEPIQDQATNLPQDLQFADQLQIFEQENPDVQTSVPDFQVVDGEISEPTEDANIEIPDGFESDWAQENVPTTKITSRHGNDRNVDVSSGISTTIPMEETNSRLQLNTFKPTIDWSEYLDPLLDWIGKNSVDIGLIPRRLVAKNDKTAKTARGVIKYQNEKFEVLLASKESKRQVTICMIEVATNKFVLLVDVGLTKRSQVYKSGTVRRDDTGQIIGFKYEQKRADNELAKKRMEQFWSWAKNLR